LLLILPFFLITLPPSIPLLHFSPQTSTTCHSPTLHVKYTLAITPSRLLIISSSSTLKKLTPTLFFPLFFFYSVHIYHYHTNTHRPQHFSPNNT
jgi:hypothetical protein